MDWITGRKPKDCEIVLASVPPHTDKNGNEFIHGVVCAYTITTPNSGTIWFRSDGCMIGELGRLEPEPVAWMPLPKPYNSEISGIADELKEYFMIPCDLCHKHLPHGENGCPDITKCNGYEHWKMLLEVITNGK